MSFTTDYWNRDMASAPSGVRIIVQDKNCYDTWAIFDPTWGGGRGAWFNDRGGIVAGVWRWCADTEKFLAERPKGADVVPIR